MTRTAADVVRIARTQVGVHEGRDASGWNNNQRYSDETPGFAWSDGQAWCDTFVAWCSWKAGFTENEWPRSASCDTSGALFKKLGRWSEYPGIGAQVFFGTPADLQHTGIVVDYDDLYIWTIEGNTNATGSYQGDGVYAKKHLRRDPRVVGYGYPKFPGGIASADPLYSVTTPKPVTLDLGLANLERGRNPKTVLRELRRFTDKHHLDAVALQELEQYARIIAHELPGYDLFADTDNPENGVLVAKGRGTDFATSEIGDGWVREGGAHRGPGEFPRVTVDGWCRIASGHWPPSTNWVSGRLIAPYERLDDVTEWAESSVRFLQRENLTRVLLSDFNERAARTGLYSPRWVADQAKADVASAGGIDWGMAVRGNLHAMEIDTELTEGSDHEYRICKVTQ